MKKSFINVKSISLALCLSMLLSGCSIFDVTDKLKDATELAEELHSSPRFWYDTIDVDGYSNLHKLSNEFFTGKPYNDMYNFGDNILLVGEGTYSDDEDSLLGSILGKISNEDSDEYDPDWDDESYVEEDYNEDSSEDTYQYSFDIYNPWKNQIIASIKHGDVTCDSYTVCGDTLLLFDYSDNTVDAYDTGLNFIQTYDLSDIGQGQDMILYSDADTQNYYTIDYDESSLIQIAGSDFTASAKDTALYVQNIASVSDSGSYILLSGVDKSSLKYTVSAIKTSDLSTAASVNSSASDSADLSDSGFICPYSQDSTSWIYQPYSGDGFTFDMDNIWNCNFIDDGSFIIHQEIYDEDSNSQTINYYLIDTEGQCTSSFSYSCGNTAALDYQYFSSNYVYLKDCNCIMFLVYTADVNPYILIWNLDEKSDSDLTFASSPISASTDDSASTESSSDWGSLNSTHIKATELEKKYGVDIYLGIQVPSEIDSFQISQDTNNTEIIKALNHLDSILALYPDNFFQQLSYGYLKGIKIYLSGEIKGGKDGYIDSPSGFATVTNDYQLLVLDCTYNWDWDYVVNHEISHLIDSRLAFGASYNPNALFSESTWTSYNPDSFSYDENYDDYTDESDFESYSTYFIDSYGTTYATEDRAEIFGWVMEDYLEGQSYDENFPDGSPLKLKLDYYCKCIRDGFDTTGWDEELPWEALLN